jgi:hypothetical protein
MPRRDRIVSKLQAAGEVERVPLEGRFHSDLSRGTAAVIRGIPTARLAGVFLVRNSPTSARTPVL